MDSIVSPWESIFSTKRCWLLDSLVNIFSGDGKKLIGLLVIASSIFRYWNITRTRELIVLFNVRQITANSYCVICVYLASLFQKGLSETVLTSVLHRINWSHFVINQLKTVSEAEKKTFNTFWKDNFVCSRTFWNVICMVWFLFIYSFFFKI